MITIKQNEVGLLYVDGAFERILKPGAHTLKDGWFDRAERTVVRVDMRERSMTIKGQEILTSDKVAIRVSLLVYFRVADAVAATHNVAAYEERIYEDVQLAARRFLASRTLDAILSDRNDISDAVREALEDSANRYGVEILRADVKDLVFPGNLREIMNRVLETERRTEAALIEARREAEALRIKTAAQTQAAVVRLETERDQLRLRLDCELDEARALQETPELLTLRRLKALEAMASAGGRFVVGLQADDLKTAFSG